MEEGKPAGIFQFSLAEELVHQSEVRKYLLKHWKWENKVCTVCVDISEE